MIDRPLPPRRKPAPARLAPFVLLAMVVAAGASAAAPVPPGPARVASGAKIGEVAPDFTLVDTHGRERRLRDYRGKIVVLEWISPDCPIVQRLYRTETMQETHRKALAIDETIVWIAINSTHTTTAAKNDFWINEHKLQYPILLDGSGAVGRSYDARRTPHMFVVDAKGVLRYRGAIDDNRLGNLRPEDTTNFVVRAIGQIKGGAAVSPDQTKAYGCTIKYRR